jgi:hypothetical protein
MALEDAKNPLKGVSGPGKYAKRTDRIPANQYGDQKAIAEIASGAPIAKTPDVRAMPMGQVQATANAMPQEPVTPLFAPSQRPNEPITSGAPVGAGPGSESLMMNQSSDTDADKARMLSYLPALEAAAQAPTSSQAFRNYVRVLRANLL